MAKTNFDYKNKIWYGETVPSECEINCSAGAIVIQKLRKYPNKVAQISANNGLQITNKEMASLTIRVAQNLQLRGYQQEDVIGLVASNSLYLAPVVFGAFLCGTPISPLDPSFRKSDIKHIYGITKPKIIFCDAECYQNVKESIEELNLDCAIFTLKGKVDGVDTVNVFFKSVGAEDDFIFPNLNGGGDQTVAILCSSGTTGLPKGVCVSHSFLINKTKSVISKRDICLHFSTLYWLSGLFMLMFAALNGATHIIVDEPFSVKKCFDIIEKYRVSVILTSPSQLAALVQSREIESINLSSIRLYMCGGSALHPQFYRKMQTNLKNGYVIFGYGMTETCGSGTGGILNAEKSRSSGQLLTNTEIKLIDYNGKSLGIDETGEILIRTPFKWSGYYGNPEATRNICDKDGWIHSGDLGYFDEDGYLFVVDRIKDILKYKNYHFYPTEIESVILEIPDVVEVSVCGIPDLICTDLPAAAIVKRPASNLSEEEVYVYVAKKMSDMKHLRGGIYFFDSLPKTASGKVQRNKVKSILIKFFEKQNSKLNIKCNL